MMFLEPVFALWEFLIQNKPKKNQFPLLKLPQLVLLECIENLDVLQIIALSLLSKRSKSIAKLIPRNLLDIRLRFGGDPKICLRLSTDPGRDYIIDYNKDKESSEYPYFQSSLMGPKVYHFLFLKDSGNAIEDIKLMIEHICEMFRSPITGITIAEESLIDWIIKFQPTIRYVWINDDVVHSVESLARIFKNLIVTNHFRLKSIGNEPKITEPILFPSISIYNSYWFPLPTILNGTSSIIRLYGSKLTPKDINVILKQWQLGYYLYNLEYLEIETSTERYDFILEERYDFILEVLKNLYWTPNFGNEGRPTTVKDDQI